MTQKPIAIVIFLAVAGLIVWAVAGLQKDSAAPAADLVTTPVATTTTSTSASTPASIAVGEGLPVYTLADVAKHSSPKDCWTTVNGNVYNLTPFVGKHPGGEAILKICGIDGTKFFMDQHGGMEKQEKQLAGLEIGVLVK